MSDDGRCYFRDIAMHIIRRGPVIALALLTSCSQPPAASVNPSVQSGPAVHTASGQSEDAARAIALIYDRICFDACPDEAKLRNSLASLDAVEMNGMEVRSLLHDDPGRGWRLPGTPFTVTVESPPFRTCAVRRMTRDGLPTARPYIDAVHAYAQQRGLQMGPPQQVNRRLASGADTLLLGTPLMRNGSPQPVETSIYAITNYHGRFDPAVMPDAVGGVGVEVRLAHQLVPLP
jgi:hypothetical protein